MDVLGANEGDTHADDTTHDGVGGGNWETDLGAEGEVDGGGGNGAAHAKHEEGGVVFEHVDVDDLGADGVGYAGTDTDGAGEFEDRT